MDSDIVEYKTFADLNKSINYNEQNYVTQFFIIGKNSGQDPVDLVKMEKHIKLQYVQVNADYTSESSAYSQKFIKAKECDRILDFGKNNETKTNYDYFKNNDY